MTNEEAIGALIMCQELMLFDPMTGETTELWQENKDNQDLYNACGVALEALRAFEHVCATSRTGEGVRVLQWFSSR